MTSVTNRTVLVLSGGNALGAYQAGAYDALHASGLRPDWIAGTSTGAINAALIAGNPPDRRVERLRRFWSAAAEQVWSTPVPGPWRRAARAAGLMQTSLFGRPAIFVPNIGDALSGPSGLLGALGMYDLSPLRTTLTELVDFDYLNNGSTRLTVVATDLASGEEILFDTEHDRIGPEHIQASCALLPDFRPVEVDGRMLGDGGLSSNLPLDAVIRDGDTDDLLCFALDLFSTHGAQPNSLITSLDRRQDLLLALQSRKCLNNLRDMDRLQQNIRKLGERLSAKQRADPETAALLAEADRAITLFHLIYRPTDEIEFKIFDFSATAVAERWQTGTRDMQQALSLLDGRKAQRRVVGVHVHQIG